MGLWPDKFTEPVSNRHPLNKLRPPLINAPTYYQTRLLPSANNNIEAIRALVRLIKDWWYHKKATPSLIIFNVFLDEE